MTFINFLEIKCSLIQSNPEKVGRRVVYFILGARAYITMLFSYQILLWEVG